MTDSLSGTHVSGSAVGSTYSADDNEVNSFAGTAPDASLIFADLAPSSRPEMLLTPIDLKAHYFPFFHENNVNIISQSWGSFSLCNVTSKPPFKPTSLP